MRPIRPAPLSVNHKFPSGPVVIPSGCTISTKGIGKLVAVMVSSVRISSRCDSRASAGIPGLVWAFDSPTGHSRCFLSLPENRHGFSLQVLMPSLRSTVPVPLIWSSYACPWRNLFPRVKVTSWSAEL